MTDKYVDRIKLLQMRMMLTDFAFYACLLGHLKLVRIDDPSDVDTMAVDGIHLFFHPPFLDTLDDPELTFVLVHEANHVALEHFARIGDREPGRWNKANDYIINAMQVDGGMTMPKVGLLDRKYDGLTSEEVYNMLPPSPPQGGGGNGKDPGRMGGVRKPAPGDGTLSQIVAENRVKVMQSASLAKSLNHGTLPAAVQRIIDEVNKPKVDWAEPFRRLINSSRDTDYTWSRPNKRFISQGFYLPGKMPNSVDHVVIAVDTSGSINGEILKAFVSEMNGIIGDGNIDRVTVVYADAAVQSVETFERGDPLDIHPAGGGGTAFSDTFRWIEENANDCVCVVYLTDLYVSDYGEQPHCPVIWAVHGESRHVPELIARTPFGDGVHVNP